jgi:hypothetical protein
MLKYMFIALPAWHARGFCGKNCGELTSLLWFTCTALMPDGTCSFRHSVKSLSREGRFGVSKNYTTCINDEESTVKED